MATILKKGAKKSWYVRYYDEYGKRRDRSSRTTCYRTAERLAKKLDTDVAEIKSGLVDRYRKQIAQASRSPIGKHLDDYLEHCRREGLSKKHIEEKERHFRDLLQDSTISTLGDLSAEVVDDHLRRLDDEGKAPSTVNTRRKIWISFASWCQKRRRLDYNPLLSVPRRDERGRRVRVRRPLSDEELSRLIAVATPKGRAAWYLAAALGGLRKGDLKALQWRDVDFEQSFIRIRDGKAKREDLIPLHPQLARELAARKPVLAKPLDRVFPAVVTDLTRRKDFLAAGLARVEKYDQGGEVKERIVTEDEEGRVVDLHAMRTTLGTALARRGIAPQIAQQIMRHRDYRTTLRHYTALSLSDAAKVMEELPAVSVGGPPNGPPSRDDLARSGASACENGDEKGSFEKEVGFDVSPEKDLRCASNSQQYRHSGRVTQLARVPPLQGGSSQFESGHAHQH